MFLRRRRTQRRYSSLPQTDDTERLLPAIELQDYRIDAIIDASQPTDNFSEVDTSPFEEDLESGPYEASPRKRLRRVTTSLKIRRRVSALIRRPQQHFRSHKVIVRDSQELDGHDRIENSFETQSVKDKRKRHSWKDFKPWSESEDGLRSTISWYFWSPSDTVKDCPTLEFVRIRLAPPNVWL